MQILSEQLLLATKMEQSTVTLAARLAKVPSDNLFALKSDDAKKAFWINLYNAFFLILRKEKRLEKPAIFRDKLITVADIKLSLDDIEHGILRKYRWKWSLGYLPNPFTRSAIRHLAVKQIDPRIHFALNCGAKSCPPIAFYKVQNLEQQLEMAARSFLESETKLYPDKKEIHTSRLLLWYKGDFGSKSKTLNLLGKYLQQNFSDWTLQYRPYDWSEALGNFSD